MTEQMPEKPQVPEEAEFVLPDYLEPWRSEIEAECGGCSVEQLLNDKETNGFNNAIKAALISMADTKVRMLARLHKRGQLQDKAAIEADCRKRWEEELLSKQSQQAARAVFPQDIGEQWPQTLRLAFQAALDSMEGDGCASEAPIDKQWLADRLRVRIMEAETETGRQRDEEIQAELTGAAKELYKVLEEIEDQHHSTAALDSTKGEG